MDARADIYSLGCVLHQMLSGRVVFERDSEMQTMWAHVHDPPPRLAAELPPGLQRVLDRALAKQVDDRQQTAAEFAEQVAEALRT